MNRESSICVLNSVHWYDAIFRTHGLSGTIADGMWTSLDRPPPYYSNAITLTSSEIGRRSRRCKVWSRAGPAVVREGQLLRCSISRRWAFGRCSMRNGSGPTTRPWPTPERGASGWRPVTTPTELERWEAAWSANGSPTDRPVFMPGTAS